MGFISGLAHVVGDVAAPVLKGAGAVIPGSEGNRLSSIGAAIANPNVTLNNASGILGGSNVGSFSPVNRISGGGAGGGGATGGGAASYAQASPAATSYGAYGSGASGLSNALNQIQDQQGQYVGQAQNSFGSVANDYQNQANTLLGTLNQGQTNVNNEITSAEQSKIQSLRQLLNEVHQRQQGNAAQLDASGALGSSAADVLGRALANYGNTQRANIGTQEQAALDKANQDQQNLNVQQQSGLQALHSTRDNAVLNVGNQIASQLQQLDYQANNLGLSGKVQVDALKNQVVNEGLQKLQAVDAWLSGQTSGIQPVDTQTAAQQAYQKLQGGLLNTGSQFTFDQGQDPSSGVSTTPGTQQGIDTSLLPFYLRPGNNDQNNQQIAG